MLSKILDMTASALELVVWLVIFAIAGFAITLICSTAQAQQVRLDLFPQAEPVRLELFPAADPVRLEMFAPPAPAPKRQRSKEVVPAPIDGPAVELPVVYVYHVSWCIKDRPIWAEYRAALAGGQSLPFQMKPKPGPEWMTVCPTIHYPSRRSPNGWDVQQGNWPGMREFVRIFEAAQVKQQPIRRAEVSTHDLIRQLPLGIEGYWVNGDIKEHIREHGFTGSLDGLSYQELERLHDGLHAGLIPSGPVRRVMSPDGKTAYDRFIIHERRPRRSSGRIMRGPKQFDPFLAISILGLLFNILGPCPR